MNKNLKNLTPGLPKKKQRKLAKSNHLKRKQKLKPTPTNSMFFWKYHT